MWLQADMTAEELCDTVSKVQFLAALPEEVCIWVSERKPKTTDEAGELAEDYYQAHSAASSLAPPQNIIIL